jgi:hypothetical protein
VYYSHGPPRALQENLRSPHEYRANGTISAIVQEFLAACIGGYRQHIKSPAQQTPTRPPTASARLSGGMSKLRARLSESRGSSNSLDANDRQGSVSGSEPAYMDDHVIQGTNGYRFYHSAFVESFSGRASREFAAALIHTQLWQARSCVRLSSVLTLVNCHDC